MKRSEIVAETRKYLGVKFRKMGRTSTGLDCYGLIILVSQAFAIHMPDTTYYGIWPTPEYAKGVANAVTKQVDPPFKDGQIAMLHFAGNPCHVGILSTNQFGQRSIIHSSIARKKCVEEPLEGELGRHLTAVFELPGTEDDG